MTSVGERGQSPPPRFSSISDHLCGVIEIQHLKWLHNRDASELTVRDILEVEVVECADLRCLEINRDFLEQRVDIPTIQDIALSGDASGRVVCRHPVSRRHDLDFALGGDCIERLLEVRQLPGAKLNCCVCVLENVEKNSIVSL